MHIGYLPLLYDLGSIFLDYFYTFILARPVLQLSNFKGSSQFRSNVFCLLQLGSNDRNYNYACKVNSKQLLN